LDMSVTLAHCQQSCQDQMPCDGQKGDPPWEKPPGFFCRRVSTPNRSDPDAGENPNSGVTRAAVSRQKKETKKGPCSQACLFRLRCKHGLLAGSVSNG
jgi:hypothetical protein